MIFVLFIMGEQNTEGIFQVDVYQCSSNLKIPLKTLISICAYAHVAHNSYALINRCSVAV
jgi:hypothetical protein